MNSSERFWTGVLALSCMAVCTMIGFSEGQKHSFYFPQPPIVVKAPLPPVYHDDEIRKIDIPFACDKGVVFCIGTSEDEYFKKDFTGWFVCGLNVDTYHRRIVGVVDPSCGETQKIPKDSLEFKEIYAPRRQP